MACDRPALLESPASQGIVSLSPAASDLLVAMGLRARIVGVSGFEANDDLRKNAPNVGDYQRIDWERIADLRPKFLVIQGSRDRLPSGISERCRTLGVTPIVLSIDRFNDIQRSVRELGEALDAEAAARDLNETLSRQLEEINDQAAPRTPTLLVLNETGSAVVGRDNFINDALEAAGGANVIAASGYPSIDREKLSTLAPKAAFVLLPGANAAMVARATSQLAEAFPKMRVFVIVGDKTLLPGTAMIDLAKQFADDLKMAGS